MPSEKKPVEPNGHTIEWKEKDARESVAAFRVSPPILDSDRKNTYEQMTDAIIGVYKKQLWWLKLLFVCGIYDGYLSVNHDMVDLSLEYNHRFR